MQKKILAIVMTVSLVVMMVPPQAYATSIQDQITALTAQLAALQAQLGTSPAPVAGSFDTTLYFGMRSEKVRDLQNFLISKGYLGAGYNTAYFGSLTRSAVSAYQTAKGITPTAGYFGAITRAAANADLGGVTPSGSPVPVPGSDIVAMVTLPGMAVAKNSQDVTFMNLNFSSGAAGYTVSRLVINRAGVSSNSDIAAVKLYDGLTQVGSTQALNTNTSTATFSINWTVPANTVKTLTVKGNIASGATPGNSVTLGVLALSSLTTTSSILTGTFPMMSNAMTIAGVSVGYLDVDKVELVAASSVLSGSTDQPIVSWRFQATTEGFSVRKIKVTQVGSASSSDLANLKLKVDGVQIGSTVAALASDNSAIFYLTSPLTINVGQAKYVYAYADVLNGLNSGRTVIFEITQTPDVEAYGTNSGGGVTITNTPGAHTAYVRQTGNQQLIFQGALQTAIDTAYNPSAQAYVKGTTNRLMTAIRFTAGSTEGVRVTQINLTNAGTSAAATDIANVTLWDAATNTLLPVGSFSQVGTTIQIGSNTIGSLDTTLPVASNGLFDVPASTNKTILVKADVSSGADVTHTIKLNVTAAGDVKAHGLTSRYDVTNTGTVTASIHTITANGSLVVALAPTTPAAQTYAKGSTAKEFTKINFTAGSGEDVSVSGLIVKAYVTAGTGTPTVLGDLTNVKLMKADGSQYGSTYVSPVSSSSFNGTLNVPAGTTVPLTVVADVPTGTALGGTTVHINLVNADVTATGVYSGASLLVAVDVTGSATGNLMAVGTPTLAVAASAVPVATSYVTGTTAVTMTRLLLTAGNSEAVKVTTAKITFDNVNTLNSDSVASTLFNNVKLMDGTTQIGDTVQITDAGAGVADYAQFSGINNLTVPAGQTKSIDVVVDVIGGAAGPYFSGHAANADIVGSGVTSNASVTSTGGVKPGLGLTIVGTGGLTVSVDSTTPVSSLVAVGLSGKSNVEFSKVKLTATSENTKTSMIKFTLSGGAASDFTSFTLEGVTSYMSGTTVTFNFVPGSEIIVPAYGEKVLSLKANLAGVTNGVTSGDKAYLYVADVATDLTSTGVSSGLDIVETNGSPSAQTDTNFGAVVMYRTIPTVSLNSGLVAGKLMPGAKTVVAMVDVQADAAYGVSLEEISVKPYMSVSVTGGDGIHLYNPDGTLNGSILNLTDTGTIAGGVCTSVTVTAGTRFQIGQRVTFNDVTRCTGTATITNIVGNVLSTPTGFTWVANGADTLNPAGYASGYQFSLPLTTAYPVPAGTTKTFTIKADTNGLGTTGYAYRADITRDNDAAVGTTGDFVWNDSSSDANGYLVKNLPLTGVTLSY